MLPFSTLNRVTKPSMPLSAGSIWRGCQHSGSSKYDVEVRICNVDELGDVSGTLTIRNLTPTLPKITTFFDGEVIGIHHPFATNKWGATEQDDLTHWNRFNIELPSCYPWADEPEAYEREDVAFLRLKERYIVNQPEDEGGKADLKGASFSGFYYIALELNPSPTFSTGRKRETVSTPTAKESLLSQSRTSFSHRDEDKSDSLTAPSLIRNESYADAVIHGRTPSPPASPRSATVTIPVDIASGHGKIDDANASVVSAFSPEEYPLPSSPFLVSPSPGRHNGFPFEQTHSSHHQQRSRSQSSSPSSYSSSISSTSTSISSSSYRRRNSMQSSEFYNAHTKYRGPWAHSTMRGFYFASSSEPFQELELNYVGDGMGMPREEVDENNETRCSLGDPVLSSNVERYQKEILRRANYSRPKAFASFEMM